MPIGNRLVLIVLAAGMIPSLLMGAVGVALPHLGVDGSVPAVLWALAGVGVVITGLIGMVARRLERSMVEPIQTLQRKAELLNQEVVERKRAEAEQARLLQELAAANRELNQFAYVVSHDLKAPLRGISSLVEWVVSDYAQRLDEKGRQQLALIGNRVKRVNDLIEGRCLSF